MAVKPEATRDTAATKAVPPLDGVWLAPPAPHRPRRTPGQHLVLLARGLGSLAGLVMMLVGLPAALVYGVGWPLPHGWHEIWAWLNGPSRITARGLVDTGACVLWLMWAALVVAVAIEVVAAVRRVQVPRLALASPLQGLAAGLVGTAVIALTSTAARAAPPPQTTPAAAAAHPVHPATFAPGGSRTAVPPSAAAQGGQVTLIVGGQHYTATVRRGDTLSAIARDWLGDPGRWPEIYELNRGRHFADVGGTLTDPDLIYPGWVLRLPDDARAPGAAPTGPGPATPGPPAPSQATTPPPPPATPHPSADPAPVIASPSRTTPASPTPASCIPAAAADPAPSAPAPDPTPRASAPDPTPRASAPDPTPRASAPDPARSHRAGVQLPGGWVPVTLAGALVAAAAMVWLRRRHRYVATPPGSPTLGDPDLRALPPVMTRLRRAVREQAPELLDPLAPGQPTVAEYTSRDTDEWAELPPIGPSGLDLAGVGDRVPAGGLGLAGPGAASAARALLVATLSAGSPDDPDACGQVVIPADTLGTLLGVQATGVSPIPRLVVTANLPEALTRVEELLIERRRLLDEYEAADLAGMRAADPYHPPMPPVLLLCQTPPAELRARLTTTLHLATPLQISAALLGDWPRGDTLDVRPDGHTSDGDSGRLAVLDVPTALQLLEVLREAHTGETTGSAPVESPPAGIDPAATPVVGPHTSDRTAEPADDSGQQATAPAPDSAQSAPAQPAGDAAVDAAAEAPAAPAEPAGGARGDTVPPPRPARRPRVRIRLLGDPTIVDRDGTPVPGLRHHARQLLAYLAVHRNGANLSQIMEAFWPDAKVGRARERLSTETWNLRERIRQAAGDAGIQPVVNTGSRYHLAPDLVDIDVWALVDGLREAAATTDPVARTAALRTAVDAHAGTLADGHDYDWIDQPREQIRRHGIRARLHLADLIAGTDPRAAADLTQAAANLDPINEDVARQAMRALAAVGAAAGIRAQLQRLRDALNEIDEEPSGETIALAAQLQRQISDAGGQPDHDPPDETPPTQGH